MACHSQVQKENPKLEPIRASWKTGQPVEWVQLDGMMIFTYEAPGYTTKEPVAWPQASHILVPTVLEDGVRKFDGYCSEPSVREAAVALH